MSTPPVISALPDVPATSDPQFEIKAPALFNAIKNTFIGEVNSVASWINAGSWLTNPLAVGSGGTGLTTIPAGRILYGNNTSAVSTSANLTYDGTTFSVLGNLTVDTSTLVVNAATNRVGIGTTNPVSKLHVNGMVAQFGIGQGFAAIGYGSDLTNYEGLICSHQGVEGSRFITVGMGTGTIRRFNWLTWSGSSPTHLMTLTPAGDLGLNTTTPSARIHAISTTEQLRLGYDVSNYTSLTTDSGGNFIISPTGGGIRINQTPAGAAGAATGTFLTLNLNGTVYKIALLANA